MADFIPLSLLDSMLPYAYEVDIGMEYLIQEVVADIDLRGKLLQDYLQPFYQLHREMTNDGNISLFPFSMYLDIHTRLENEKMDDVHLKEKETLLSVLEKLHASMKKEEHLYFYKTELSTVDFMGEPIVDITSSASFQQTFEDMKKQLERKTQCLLELKLTPPTSTFRGGMHYLEAQEDFYSHMVKT